MTQTRPPTPPPSSLPSPEPFQAPSSGGGRDVRSALPARRTPRVHPAWYVAAVAFVTIVGAAAFVSLPGLLVEPLHTEFA